MERLTEKDEQGNKLVLKNSVECVDEELRHWSISGSPTGTHTIRGYAVDKFSEYEDLEGKCIKKTTWSLRMLLEKWKEFFGDITELYKYRKLEEQGLLLKLPCKVGDTLYSVSFKKKCHEYKENGGYLINSDIECIPCELSGRACGSKKEYFIKEIKATLPMIANLIEQPKGFSVFLTQVEAEEALKGMGREE